MKISLPSTLAVTALLVASAPSCDAYMIGPRTTTGGVRFSTGILGPVISYNGYTQRPGSSVRPTPVPRRTAAITAVPAQPQKNAAQRMLDICFGMVWIARPDLFLYDRLARLAWDNVSKTLKQLEQDNLPENVLNKALKEMKVSNTCANECDLGITRNC